MEIKQIKELMAVMQRTGTKRLVIKKEDMEIELERENRSKVIEPSLDLIDDNPMKEEIAIHRANMLLSKANEALPINNIPHQKEAETTPGTFVTSPMVGTFYFSPSPEDPAFVKVGDRVEKDTLVCIIEAMKVMNEVKANVSGTVSELLVENGNPVEFGTKLFRIS
jgi:acetyl-CoA carboxylase biotin carboxyl carrier protein